MAALVATSARRAGIWQLVFGAMLLDSMVVYFLRTLTGKLWPVNFVVAGLTLCAWAVSRDGHRMPSGSVLAGLFACLAGFSFGIVQLEEMSAYRGIEMAGAALAFFVGYLAFANARSADTLATLLLWIGGAYVVVCIAALWRIAPAWLPIIDSVGLDGGVLLVRPEVTIDQNFQVYYLFIVALPLALPYRPLRYATALLLTAGAALVLIRLQTRSGALILAALVAAGWLLQFRRQERQWQSMLILPALCTGVALLYAERIAAIAAPLTQRFTGGDFATLEGRLDSAAYFFSHVLQPQYWIPRGNLEFVRATGDVPHFNPAAFLLEGGLIALIGWLLLHFWPLLRLATRAVLSRIDPIASLALLGGAASFVASLSLNAPHFKQAWMWTGAVCAALAGQAAAGSVAARTSLVTTGHAPAVPRFSNLMP